ncbi:MAG: AsmA family protein, partial [Desulfobulbaceae bacterium]|nr:AsmA family protein [Desulfobulbaceae bacterium]
MRIPARNKSLYILLTAVVVLSAILLAPHLLDVKAIKGKVADRLRQDLHGEVAIGALQLRWLPTPHVFVRDLDINNDELKASLPVVDLYPDWLSLLPGRPYALRSLVLKRPQIVLKKLAGKGAAIKLPSLAVKVVDGSIVTPAIDTIEPVDVPSLSLSSVNATINMDPQSLSLSVSGSAPFVKNLALKGRVDLDSLRYEARVDCKGLVLRKGKVLPPGVVSDFAAGDSLLSFGANIEGEGTDNFSGEIIGDMPCLLYTAKGRETPINCGFGNFSIKKEGRAFSLKINDFEVKEPGLSLKGVVSRTPEDGLPDKWHIDLAAEKLDLAAIRSGVLNMLPTNKIAALVCDIVRSGEANSGSFRFDGPLSDMAHLHSMTI